MKIIKYIVGVIAGIILLSFAYTYFFTVKLPQECLEYKRSYDDVVQLVEPFKDDPQVGQVYQSLISTGKQLDEVFKGDQRFDKSKAEGLKMMCTQQKQATEQLLEWMKSAIAAENS